MAALVDASRPDDHSRSLVSGLDIDGYADVREVSRCGIAATGPGRRRRRSRRRRTRPSARPSHLPLDPRADRQRRSPRAGPIAPSAFKMLAEVEGAMHGRAAADDVEFHEVGSVSAIVDVVGTWRRWSRSVSTASSAVRSRSARARSWPHTACCPTPPPRHRVAGSTQCAQPWRRRSQRAGHAHWCGFDVRARRRVRADACGQRDVGRLRRGQRRHRRSPQRRAGRDRRRRISERGARAGPARAASRNKRRRCHW